MRRALLLVSLACFAGSAMAATQRRPQADCVAIAFRNYPASFEGGVTSVYKFRMGLNRADVVRFMDGVQALGAALAPVQIEGVDFVFVMPAAPSYSLSELRNQVHAICDLSQARGMSLFDYQHRPTGRSEERR
jgi:hypothetical protein